jgi:hypothetical protein
VPTLDRDRAPADDVAEVAQLVASGAFTTLLAALLDDVAVVSDPTKGP